VATLHSKPGKQIHTRGTKESRKYTKRDQEKPSQTNPNQMSMEVVELISMRERQGSNSNKPGTNQAMDQQKSNTRNPIQQEQGSESNKNPQLDPARPTARSNKNDS